MLKIISNVVVFSYRLTVDNRPHPSDELQLSGHSKELFAIAESAVINTDDIRKVPNRIAVTKVQPGMTIVVVEGHLYTKWLLLAIELSDMEKTSIPILEFSGVTLSYEDYYDITRKSSNLPPRLPSRPQSMRLGHRMTLSRSLSEDTETITTNLRHSQTVRLPSRSLSQKSLAQRFDHYK